MNEKYHRLRAEDCKVIRNLREGGSSQEEIAVAIGSSQGTVSKELSRNCGKSGYRPKEAGRLARLRFRVKRPRGKVVAGEVRTEVEARLRIRHSSEQISGKLEKRIEPLPAVSVSIPVYDTVKPPKAPPTTAAPQEITPREPRPWLPLLWLAGAFLGLAYLALGRVVLWRLRTRREPANAPWLESLDAVGKETDTAIGARIFFVPGSVGILRSIENFLRKVA